MQSHPDHDLLQAYLDGALNAGDAAALEARLTGDTTLADALALMAREEAIFREWSATTSAAEQVSQSTVAELSSAGVEPARRPGIRLARWAAVVAIAASALVLAVYLTPPRDTAPGTVVATLENVQGEVKIVARNGKVEFAANGSPIFAGQEVQTGADDSSTVVQVRDCRLVLASETRVRLGEEMLSDSPLVYVSEGIVEAEVAAKSDSRPIVIRSPLAEMRGLLGKFSLASLPDATFFETDSGTAQLTRKSDGHSIQVPRGRSVMVKANNAPLEPRKMAMKTTRPIRSMAIGAPVNAIFFEPEGLSLLTSGGNSIKRWEVNSGKFVGTVFSQSKKNIRHFSPSLDGRFVALANEERSAKLLDAISGVDRQNFRRPMRLVAIALSSDGRTLAISWSAGREGHEVRLYDTVLGLERTLHTGHSGPVLALAFSPRGTFLATSGVDRSVRVWNLSDLQPAREFMKLPAESRCLAFAPDERTLAIGERKGDIRLFDLSTGSLRHVLAGHLRPVNSLAFAPDGSLLASASGDGTARMWHTAAGRELTTFKAHAGSVNSVGFSQDGRIVATGGVDRKLLLWDASSLHAD